MTAVPSVPVPDLDGLELRRETRRRWLPTEPIPEGWVSGNQFFLEDEHGEYLDRFWYDPTVKYADRATNGSTDRWIKHRPVTDERFITDWREATA